MRLTGEDSFQRRLAELAARRALWREPDDPAELSRRRVRSAWANAAIEGSSLSWTRALDLAAGAPRETRRPEREMLGCLEALGFLEQSAPDWNLALVRHLHALVMGGLGGRPGELREREVMIVKQSGEGAGRPVFHPPHPARVRELLERLMAESAAPGEDPFLVAGRFHYEFQSIHPFEDGNGRVGRLLSGALARRGWASRGFHLEPAIRRAGPGYYLALRAVRSDYEQEGHDGLLPWLLPFLDMVGNALDRPEDPEDHS